MRAAADLDLRDLEALLDGQERWRDKQGLADHFSCGVRWIEARMEDGMPFAYIAGRAKFKATKSERWLDEHGFIEQIGDAR